MSRQLRLTIELVPRSCWRGNIRNLCPTALWDEIRKNTFDEYGHKCGICGKRGSLNCHEIWDYDERTHHQILTGFIALCGLCHNVKHLGFAFALARKKGIRIEPVIEHFLKINQCDERAFEKHLAEAAEQWRKRSKHTWRLDLGEYDTLVRK